MYKRQSTILEALEIFFNQAKIGSGDKNVFHTAEDTIIGCVFDDLPSEIALENVSTSFTAEYLLNEDGDLEICKIYRTGGKQTIWINAKHPSNAGFDNLLSKKNQELKAMIRENGLENSVNLTINTEMRTALWESLGGSITYQKKLINWDQCDVPVSYTHLLAAHAGVGLGDHAADAEILPKLIVLDLIVRIFTGAGIDRHVAVELVAHRQILVRVIDLSLIHI